MCGVAVVLGLVLELLLALNNPAYGNPLERWGPVIADTFVALGVVGEILFSSRAGACQGELTRRSNDKLAYAFALASAAEIRAADAQKTVAKANERAAALELEAAKIRERISWRSLPHDATVALTNEVTKSPCAISIEYLSGDHESAQLAEQYADAFRMAGWLVQLVANTYAGPIPLGIILELGPASSKLASEMAVRGLIAANLPFARDKKLPGAIISAAQGPADFPGARSHARLYIGPKPPVQLA